MKVNTNNSYISPDLEVLELAYAEKVAAASGDLGGFDEDDYDWD